MLSYFSTLDVNEYLFGEAIFRYIEQGAEPFYGIGGSVICWEVSCPNFVWPTVYEDLPRLFGVELNLKLDAGLPLLQIKNVVGWTPAVGAAPGMAGDLLMEFGWLAPLATFLIGLLYGRTWVLARRDGGAAQLTYLLLAALRYTWSRKRSRRGRIAHCCFAFPQ